MRVPWFPDFKIDWPNHIVAFFSALFGILIAFELDSWREEKKEQQVAMMALAKMREEVVTNKTALHETTEINQALLKKLNDEILPLLGDHLEFIGAKRHLDSINNRYQGLLHVEEISNPGGKSLLLARVQLGGLFIPTLHSSAWESAKTTGVLNYMPYEKVQVLSSLYNDTRIIDELAAIKSMLREADEIKSKQELAELLTDLSEGYRIMSDELLQYDLFANMLQIDP